VMFCIAFLKWVTATIHLH